MDKQDYIQYWQKTAESDWKAVGQLYDKGSYLQSLFFAHLVLEKLLKAHWVRDNETDFPPRIHRLKSLMDKTLLTLSIEEIRILDDMEIYQLEGRYPDYHNQIGQLCTQELTLTMLESVETLKNSLLNKLL